jgi:hypothetical protein
MIIVGALFALFGLIALLGAAFVGSIGGSAADQAGVPSGMFGAFAGIIIVVAIILLAIAVLDIVAGIKVLSGRPWARITGIVVAIVLALFGLLGLAGSGSGTDAGSPIFGIVLLAANVFIVFALATTGRWFADRARV